MTKKGALIMNNEDIIIITKAIETAVEPLRDSVKEMKDAFDDLPCGDHSVSIVTLETQRDTAKEQRKDTKESKDWMLKALLGILAIATFLQTFGVFRTITK